MEIATLLLEKVYPQLIVALEYIRNTSIELDNHYETYLKTTIGIEYHIKGHKV